MKKILITFSLLLAAAAVNFSNAQNPSPGQPAKAAETGPVFTKVEQMPSFPGGDEKLFQFLKDNIQYPKEALDNKKEAKVYVSFVVDATGKISDVRMVKRAAYGMDQEAMRVVKMMPTWIPGKQNGKEVAVQYMLPVSFSLADTKQSK